MKNLFNASFEESKHLIYKRSWILLPGGDSDTKRIGESLLSGAAFWPTMAAMILLPALTYLVYPKTLKVFMSIVDFLLLGWTVFMANIYPRFHHKNWAEMHKKMVPSMLGFFLSGLIPLFPFFKDFALKNTGLVSVSFQISLIVVCFIISAYYFIILPLNKLKNKSLPLKKSKNKTLIILIVLALVFLSLSLITGTYHYLHFHKFNGEEFMSGYLLTGLIIVMVIGGFGMFKSYLSYHYIAKYPRQYRLYYKIPDSIWYFSKEEAEKRNDPVYPPKKTTNMSKEV